MIKLKAHPGGFEGVLFRENNVDQESSLEKDKRVKRDELDLEIVTLLYGAESGTNKPCHTNRLDSSTYTKQDFMSEP